jgi:hypothetical protein
MSGEISSFLNDTPMGATINIEGHASSQGLETKEPYNAALAVRRMEVMRQALVEVGGAGLNITTQGYVTLWARGDGASPRQPLWGTFPFGGPESADYVRGEYQTVIASYAIPARMETREVEVFRETELDVSIVPNPPGPPAKAPDRPNFIRRLGFRLRLERNFPVLFEINGEVDFQTALEDTASLIRTEPDHTLPGSTGEDFRTQDCNDPANPGDGIVDFRLTIHYDTATKRLTQELQLGSGDTDMNGLLCVDTGTPEVIGHVVGSLLTFAPLLAGSIDSAVSAQGEAKATEMAIAMAQITTAVGLAVTGAFKMRKIILYGVTLSAMEDVGDGVDFEQAAILFDYAVDFELDVDLAILRLRSTPDRPLRVRYRAIGFKAAFDGGNTITPVFDTSKGYEFDAAGYCGQPELPETDQFGCPGTAGALIRPGRAVRGGACQL